MILTTSPRSRKDTSRRRDWAAQSGDELPLFVLGSMIGIRTDAGARLGLTATAHPRGNLEFCPSMYVGGIMRSRLPIAIGLQLLLAGCVPFWSFSASRPGVAAPATFCGIDDAMAHSKNARVLVVHGMGLHDPTYARDFEFAIAKRLDLPLGSCSIEPRRIANPDDPDGNYGTIDTCTFNNGDRHLTFYAWNWSPLSKPFKDRFLRYDFDRPDKMRLWANRRLKAEIIDLSLSDAVLYAGHFKDNMRYGATQALCMATAETPKLSGAIVPLALSDESRSTPPCDVSTTAATSEDLYIVTHSLGSMMVFDALRKDEDLAHRVGSRLKLFAMLANQWPLLELSLQEHSDGGAASRKRTSSALGAVVKGSNDRLPIVAFSDPNDLLSFRVPDNWAEMVTGDVASKISFVNVVTSTTHAAILGIAVNPGTAHTAYWRDKRVLNALAHGYSCPK